MPQSNLKVGAIGLGIGTLTAYALPGDSYICYEINPQVIDLATRYFTFVPQAEKRANVEMVVGDARVSLERELASSGSAGYDVLVLDAFSGDAVPVHPLTEEAFALYWRHLKADGILAVHVSNLYLDLSDVVRNNARRQKKLALLVDSQGNEQQASKPSTWILVTGNRDFAAQDELNSKLSRWPRQEARDIHWTDDYSNVLRLVKR